MGLRWSSDAKSGALLHLVLFCQCLTLNLYSRTYYSWWKFLFTKKNRHALTCWCYCQWMLSFCTPTYVCFAMTSFYGSHCCCIKLKSAVSFAFSRLLAFCFPFTVPLVLRLGSTLSFLLFLYSSFSVFFQNSSSVSLKRRIQCIILFHEKNCSRAVSSKIFSGNSMKLRRDWLPRSIDWLIDLKMYRIFISLNSATMLITFSLPFPMRFRFKCKSSVVSDWTSRTAPSVFSS